MHYAVSHAQVEEELRILNAQQRLTINSLNVSNYVHYICISLNLIRSSFNFYLLYIIHRVFDAYISVIAVLRLIFFAYSVLFIVSFIWFKYLFIISKTVHLCKLNCFISNTLNVYIYLPRFLRYEINEILVSVYLYVESKFSTH